jgi:hypothetical protein
LQEFWYCVVFSGDLPVTDEPEPKKQMGLLLGRDLKARLQDAADASGHSIGEEIRLRLEHSFALETDPPVREVAEAALWMADEIHVEAGPQWWSRRTAYDVYVAALWAWLDSWRPQADQETEYAVFPGDDVETLGRSIARRYRRHRSEAAEGERILRSFRKGSQPK